MSRRTWTGLVSILSVLASEASAEFIDPESWCAEPLKKFVIELDSLEMLEVGIGDRSLPLPRDEYVLCYVASSTASYLVHSAPDDKTIYVLKTEFDTDHFKMHGPFDLSSAGSSKE